MFYRISHSLDPKVIGSANCQTVHARIDGHVDHPSYLSHYFLKKAEKDDIVVCPKPILEKKAKLTDIITYPGLAWDLLISDPLKKLLYAAGHRGVQFFPTSVIVDKKEIEGFWIMNPYEFDYDCIDLNRSIFTFTNEEKDKKKISINNTQELIDLIDTLRYPKSIMIEPLFLKENCTKDLLVIRGVYGGISFYVSEKLKREIENTGCTGIVFSKPEERYP